MKSKTIPFVARNKRFFFFKKVRMVLKKLLQQKESLKEDSLALG